MATEAISRYENGLEEITIQPKDSVKYVLNKYTQTKPISKLIKTLSKEFTGVPYETLAKAFNELSPKELEDIIPFNVTSDFLEDIPINPDAVAGFLNWYNEATDERTYTKQPSWSGKVAERLDKYLRKYHGMRLNRSFFNESSSNMDTSVMEKLTGDYKHPSKRSRNAKLAALATIVLSTAFMGCVEKEYKIKVDEVNYVIGFDGVMDTADDEIIIKGDDGHWYKINTNIGQNWTFLKENIEPGAYLDLKYDVPANYEETIPVTKISDLMNATEYEQVKDDREYMTNKEQDKEDTTFCLGAMGVVGGIIASLVAFFKIGSWYYTWKDKRNKKSTSEPDLNISEPDLKVE